MLAARRLFHEQGYEATAIATVLREADANSGSLYHFFASKEDLLEAVLEHYLTRLGPELLEPAESGAQDPIEKIFALLALYRQGLILTQCEPGCRIGNLALEVSDGAGSAQEDRSKLSSVVRGRARLVGAGGRSFSRRHGL